jgi:hypothetical protein
VAVLNDCRDDTDLVLAGKAVEHDLERCALVRVGRDTHPHLYLLDVPETYRVGCSLCGETLPDSHTGELLLADFAAARNAGWGQAEQAWRLHLDADDVVDDPHCLPGLCAALAAAGVRVAASRYRCSGSPVSGGFRERLARNDPSIVWEGAAHEKLVGFDRGEAAGLEGVLTVRDLRDGSPTTRTPGRNLKILYRQARLLDWRLSPRQKLYLAAEASRDVPDLARALVDSYMTSPGPPEEAAWACVIRGDVEGRAGDHVSARRWYEDSLACHAGPMGLGRMVDLLRSQDLHGEVAALAETVSASVKIDHFFAAGDDLVPSVADSLRRLGRGDEASRLFGNLEGGK